MIKTTDFELVYTALLNFADEMTNVRMLEAMQDATGILLEEVQTNVPVDKGNLLEDANEKIVEFSPGKGIIGGVSMMKDGQQKPYAWMREKGGTIFPKPDNPTGSLWFMGDEGHLVRVKFVIQNGSFYMENSLDNKRDLIVATFATIPTKSLGAFD